MSYLKSDYNFILPDELIATEPVFPKDTSRMLLLNREKNSVENNTFLNFPDQLKPGSLMVINNAKVIPARLPGKRKTGGAIEILLVKEIENLIWRCKIKNGARIKPGENLDLCEGHISAEFIEKTEGGEYILKFNCEGNFYQLLEEHAHAPIPPYITKSREEDVERKTDLKSYQTVFAKNRGAIAAPTAGLHFTPEVLKQVQEKGIEIVEITLYVGLGTFEPVRVDDVRQHDMHTEEYFIDPAVAEKINRAKKENRNVISIGTTTARTLESAWKDGELQSGMGETNIFIYPPYQFRVVDTLLTNFHLPESTLLMMISAFAGKEFIMNAYQKAIIEKYRFYSYGDCMLIQ